MSIYVPSIGAESWQALLADPEKHWRVGYSARTLAHAWQSSSGLPPEIMDIFGLECEILLGIPEHKVDLPGGVRPSQSDLFVLLRQQQATIACTVEGKVDEPFGPTVGEWLEATTRGKVQRLEFLCQTLGLALPLPNNLRYQLLHRSVSAIVESRRFKTDYAAMIIHSFSTTSKWFEDYSFFISLLGGHAEIGKMERIKLPCGITMLFGWAKGDPKFLQY